MDRKLAGDAPQFDDIFREQFVALLRWRRDVRHFKAEPVDSALLQSFIDAACLAPSVGYSQPWRFIDVQSAPARTAVRTNFERCNAEALASYEGERAQRYASLKLAGMRDAPTQIAVFTDIGTSVGHGLGRRTMPQTLEYSAVMAIQNFWLAARAVGVGVGWVSILDPVAICAELGAAEGWRFIAYLCVGYPQENSDEPELSRRGWEAKSEASRQILVR